MVMAQSLFKVLRAQDPQCVIDVLAPGWSLPVIARMPEVREGIVSPTAHGEFAFGKRRQLGISLRDRGYGQAIVLPRSFKAALLPWFAQVSRRTGFRGEMRYGLINDMRAFDTRRLDQTVKRFVALGLPEGADITTIPHPSLQSSHEGQLSAIADLHLATNKPVIAMMPGAEYGPAKCWPLEYFEKLASKLHAAGYAVWLFGSEKDRAAGEQIASGGIAVNLCGRTSIAQVIDLLAYCEQAVSNDSGLMHVAAAVGTRVIGLYGSTTPAFTPPLTDLADIHYLDLDCSPCFKRECPLGHLRCLREITPVAILESIKSA
jgi:heptosyltransferase-2